MADYEHSSNFHKVIAKIAETNNLKDLETLRRKLVELEQDDEVRELIAKCDERAKELKELIKEEKYRKAVSEYDLEGDGIDSQISSFREIKGYKDSEKYIESLETEKRYRYLVKLFDEGNCDWQWVSDGFKALGGYKKSKQFFEACKEKVEKQIKEKELREKQKREDELERKYQEALGYMEKGSYGYASLLFKDLGAYKDSKQKAEECKKIQDEIAIKQTKAKKKRKRNIMLVILGSTIIVIGVIILVGFTHWISDDSGHWHPILGSQVGFSEHDYSLTDEVSPTCGENGTKTYTCTICGAVMTESIPATAEHHFDGYECTVCGQVQYSIGDHGPAGGYIFYDCDADNGSGNKDGLKSSECGWRFLEAAPADLRVVNGVPTIDTSSNEYANAATGYTFGFYRTSDNNYNLYVNGTRYYNGYCAEFSVGTGRENTQKLVSAMGAFAYSYGSGPTKTGNYAARLCDILSVTKDGVRYDDWFLPSQGELICMCIYLHNKGLGDFANDDYLSSTEDYSSPAIGRQVVFEDNDWFGNDGYRDKLYRVRPVRAF